MPFGRRRFRGVFFGVLSGVYLKWIEALSVAAGHALSTMRVTVFVVIRMWVEKKALFSLMRTARNGRNLSCKSKNWGAMSGRISLNLWSLKAPRKISRLNAEKNRRAASGCRFFGIFRGWKSCLLGGCLPFWLEKARRVVFGVGGVFRAFVRVLWGAVWPFYVAVFSRRAGAPMLVALCVLMIVSYAITHF